jgi:hypothetical protein
MAFCLARNASAKPPAKLDVGVLLPLPLPLPFRLIPESLIAGAGAGFRPAAAGRLVGGVGLDRTVAPFVPLVLAAGGGGGVGRTTGAGAGAGISSLRYAEGTHPWTEPFLASHQPWTG